MSHVRQVWTGHAKGKDSEPAQLQVDYVCLSHVQAALLEQRNMLSVSSQFALTEDTRQQDKCLPDVAGVTCRPRGQNISFIFIN